MRRRTLLATAAAATAAGPARAQGEPVDVLLVLAVDVSRSVDEDEARLQREGYRTAITDPQVVEAIRGGMLTMYEDGLRKAVKGVTTFEEVLRVTRES